MKKNIASSRTARVLLAISATALLAACSSDIERLGDYPPVDNTASVAPQKVQTQPVPPVAGNASSPWSTPTPSWSRDGGYAAPVRTAARSAAPRSAYQPPRQSYRAQAAAVQPARASANGVIVVQPGQTLFSIARANGLSVAQLMRANGLSSPSIKVGQRIVIPGVGNPVSPAPTVVATRAVHAAPQPRTQPRMQPAPQPRVQPAAAPARAESNLSRRARSHRVRQGETWYALGRKYGVHPRRIAAYNGLSLSSGLRVGQVVKIPASQGWSMPGASTGSRAVAQVSKRPAASSRPQAQLAPRRVATKAEPAAPAAPAAQPKDQDRIADSGKAAPAAQQPQPKLATAKFTWPVRGRIVAGFGKKSGGARNEGINIAAPEGAPVRAAADGVVAYAGNELKDYGNLVLIRHEGGWVTAYAHNRDLKVKRGDRVRQGQVIATVGKTGAVKSAQLHFEIRKGATPVNPMAHLGTATAMR